ncbi:MAG: CDP-alcohol phosphatidyltransferase family protein [Candidatus Heimdallarchaeota archaeon]
MQIISKSNNKDGWVSRYLNRPISVYITRFILWLRPNVSPNTISILVFVITVIGSLSFAINLPLIAGLLIHTSSILDGCDGEIARTTSKQSKFGDFLDSVLDRYGDILILTGAMIFLLYNTEISLIIILFAFVLSLGGSYQISYTAAKFALTGKSFSRTIEGRDSRMFILAISAILAELIPILVLGGLILIGVITNIFVLYRILKAHVSI